MEGTPYEAHLILNDLILLAQKQKDMGKVKKYVFQDVKLYKDYKDELKERWEGTLPQIITFEIYVYLLEREGKIDEALKLAKWIKKEGISYPYYDRVKERLQGKLKNRGEDISSI